MKEMIMEKYKSGITEKAIENNNTIRKLIYDTI